MKNIIELKNIQYAYHTPKGETLALDNISFGIREGEFLAIVGPSGCGKSTLLSILAGLLQPDRGTIAFQNPDGSLQYPRIGYMLQKDHLFDWRTVYENVILGLEIQQKVTPERLAYVNQLLAEYQLDAFREKYPKELSGGMRQRAALIRTLALSPQILLMDEPFSALDYQTRLHVATDICTLIRNAKKTMLIVTHDLSEAISLADRVLIMSHRPAIIKREVSIHLTVTEPSPLAARNAPQFQTYFNLLWKELIDHESQKETHP